LEREMEAFLSKEVAAVNATASRLGLTFVITK
jgi:hypothetical protein